MSLTYLFSQDGTKAVVVPNPRGVTPILIPRARRTQRIGPKVTRLRAINVHPLVHYISCDKRVAKSVRYTHSVYTVNVTLDSTAL